MECDELDNRHSDGSDWILSNRTWNEVLPVAHKRELSMLNWSILKHPLNWIIILMMLILAGIAGHLVLSTLGIEPATDNSNS